MFYKDQKNYVYSFFASQEEGNEKIFVYCNYNQNDWENQVNIFCDHFSKGEYDSIKAFNNFILRCPSSIPYQYLCSTSILEMLISFINTYANDIAGDIKIQSLILTSERDRIYVHEYLAISFNLLHFLIGCKECLAHKSINNIFFISLTKLCFIRNIYYLYNTEDESMYNGLAYPLCIGALMLIRHLFDLDEKLLFYFEKKFEFSRFLWQQYIMAQRIDIKCYSLKAIIPWMKYFPGNQRIYSLFVGEIEKMISNTSKFVNIESILGKKSGNFENRGLILSHFLEGIVTFVKPSPNTHSNYTKLSSEAHPESNPDTNINANVETNPETYLEANYNNDEEIEFTIDSDANLLFAFQNNVYKFAAYGILSRNDESVLSGLKILNQFLKAMMYENESLMNLIDSIKDTCPVILNISKEHCHEEMKMIKYLMRINPQFCTLLNDKIMIKYFLIQFNSKKLNWRISMISFLGHFLNEMPFDVIKHFIEISQINIIELLLELEGTGFQKQVISLLNGVIRCVSSDINIKLRFQEQNISELIEQLMENTEFSERAQILENCIAGNE
ncbi:hypothetical protein TRFO_29086 [Tritrichomonas foetus]|uniref:Uncharacterized protein n=1 Tax=Tritrichomonas foetus TaxID=1144522 RepID=A0A1J4K1B4_9EUKA|nr:hypothetical protein TRFO_29086 [Tritrichomonas foetus]|eukprot:OHT03532.1 hypothetical protein TRFO_29086 [Tritrichomonas foetus]